MKIVIDARFWGPSHTGLGVYTRELIRSLAKIDSQNSYIILVRQDSFDQIHLPENFTKVVVEAPAYTIKEQLLLPLVLYRTNPDLVHFPSINTPLFYFGKFVATIHDLIKHKSRGKETSTHHPLQYYFKYVVYLALTKLIVRNASKIIVPSHSVKKEVINNFKLASDKIVVTYEAPTLTPPKKQFDFPDKFAIYTGNAYPHKNLQTLISIWPKVFAQTKMTLLISSGRGVFSSRIEKMIHSAQIERWVHYAGFLSDEQLASAYSQASLYVFPTLLEGFGIPGLDAMNLGLPVVCSNIPVLREIYGSAAHYFDPKDPQDMTDKIIQVATDPKLRSRLIKAGRAQVKKYSWQRMARETLEVYKTIDDRA